MSKARLQRLLKDGLALERPIFKLEKIGSKWAGSIVSASFKGKSDRQRQKMIWDLIDAELSAASVHEVGTLLAYTPEEWEPNFAAEAGR